MNFYTVELKRTSYVTLQIEAESAEDAETKAWAELQAGESYGLTDDADWNLESIEKQENAA